MQHFAALARVAEVEPGPRLRAVRAGAADIGQREEGLGPLAEHDGGGHAVEAKEVDADDEEDGVEDTADDAGDTDNGENHVLRQEKAAQRLEEDDGGKGQAVDAQKLLREDGHLVRLAHGHQHGLGIEPKDEGKRAQHQGHDRAALAQEAHLSIPIVPHGQPGVRAGGLAGRRVSRREIETHPPSKKNTPSTPTDRPAPKACGARVSTAESTPNTRLIAVRLPVRLLSETAASSYACRLRVNHSNIAHRTAEPARWSRDGGRRKGCSPAI